MTATPAILTAAQATLELTAEHVGKRLLVLGPDYRLADVLLEAVAACRAARTVGQVPAAATMAAPLVPVSVVAEPPPRRAKTSVATHNVAIARRAEIDDVVRGAIRRLGDRAIPFDELVEASAGTEASRTHYKTEHSHRAAIRESMHRLRGRGELEVVRGQKHRRGVAVIPTPALLAHAPLRGVA